MANKIVRMGVLNCFENFSSNKQALKYCNGIIQRFLCKCQGKSLWAMRLFKIGGINYFEELAALVN